MAKAELGIKRVCLSCNMRFYDFDRSPIICPGCGAEFDPQRFTKSQKSPKTPQAQTAVNESIVEADKVTDVDTEGPVDGGTWRCRTTCAALPVPPLHHVKADTAM